MPIVSIEKFHSVSFDYLILGGGTCGLALASRLSEDENLVVGVIEAGGVPADIPEITVPGFMGRIIGDPTYDWAFLSVPQAHAKGRTVLQPRGKGLGGTSIINFMGLFRPSRAEYDALEGLGNKGWNWENLLGYMKKGENTFPSRLSPEDAKIYAANPKEKYHGVDGPLQKSLPLNIPPQNKFFFDAVEALGVPRNESHGDGSNVGSTTCFTSVDPRSAQRSSAFTAYFLPIQNRPNLLVLTNAQVTKVILLEGSPQGEQTAIGVEFVHGGKQNVIKGVKKDVVVSAGAFQTPHLLELSGIGDRSVLAKHGIETLIHLPGVGENLHEHPSVATTVEIDSKYETMDIMGDPNALELHTELYKQRKGLLSSIASMGFSFLSRRHLNLAGDAVSFKSLHEPTDSTLCRGLNKQYSLQKEWFAGEEVSQAEIIYQNGYHRRVSGIPTPGKRYASFVHVVMHPLSRGSVHLSSADPLVPPAINPNYLAHPTDLKILEKAVEFSARIATTGSFGESVKGRVVPDQEILDDPDKLREWIRESIATTYHPLGTAAMLPKEDGGVVDSELRVYGTRNLRVADVSILPMQLSCHIQSAAYAIAEKAADILRIGGGN
ncbi:Dehydrogenase mpl7 [Psilocybe cubensis]|uniref:Dehydrogenase mpl7 n=1 Tax=Psilocybe cubensis TaxID=181762 RepID=A0ACB8H1N8_PSICU|nr:Dehydrogenase mpl7 [Psilocybe cubensis]KAH9481557.1 Dehydrogenase mpl7 [Psilocybe cubensis]